MKTHTENNESKNHTYTIQMDGTLDGINTRDPVGYSHKSEWRIPYGGLLNPEQTYYWRIRPRNANGLWGNWSSIWLFTPKAPGIPPNVGIKPDWDARTLTLYWQANPRGNLPAHYEIYGRNERGFTASREPYKVITGKKQSETFPSGWLRGIVRNTAHRALREQNG